MLNLESIFVFILVFSILVLIKHVFKFMSALLQREPKPVILSNRELIYLGLSLSYIITYFITL